MQILYKRQISVNQLECQCNSSRNIVVLNGKIELYNKKVVS